MTTTRNAGQPAQPAAPSDLERALEHFLSVARIEGSMSSDLSLEQKAAQHRQLTIALEIAKEQHAGKVDRCGAPYLLHPLSVACRVADQAADQKPFRRAGWVTRAMTVALLHDVLEDSVGEESDLLARGIDADLARYVVSLTRRLDESYSAYIERVASAGEIPRAVKIADLRENLRPDRWHKDFERLRPRYEKALARLA